MKLDKICVYCGSSRGVVRDYTAAGEALGRLLADRDIELVYGGANIGVMGAVANGALAAGGRVTGVIPKALFHKEVAHSGLTALEVVEDMHERKARMAELANGFITLPGGLGTLEELFEMLTWSQLGFHEKPIGLLNINQYFDALIKFLQHSVDQGFIKPIHQQLYRAQSNPDDLLNWMQEYRSPIRDKWTEK